MRDQDLRELGRLLRVEVVARSDERSRFLAEAGDNKIELFHPVELDVVRGPN
jgi:hypothetical protein